ncbi:hypothetical protein GCM10028864_67520 [Microlunatus parietis]|uniref:hypothetical protein n=1 Tax=Microlunatus parietis TaxID=682979 RepID=UPI001C540AC8|nr:hypothetical protein [Microlunatus parietis]
MGAAELAYPGFDAAQLTQDDPSLGGSIGHPVTLPLECVEDEVEALLEVGDDVIMIERHSMPRMQCGRRPADENGIGHQRLEPCRRFQYLDQVLTRLRGLALSRGTFNWSVAIPNHG